jgi:hypothetical protein
MFVENEEQLREVFYNHIASNLLDVEDLKSGLSKVDIGWTNWNIARILKMAYDCGYADGHVDGWTDRGAE